MVPHCYSPLSSAPVQWSPTLPYGSPLLFSAFFRTSSVIPNLTLWFPIAILRFLPYQFNDPQPYLTVTHCHSPLFPYQFSDPQPYFIVPHCYSPLSSAPVQWSPTLPYCSPMLFSAFFRTSSVVPNLTLRWPIAILRFLPYLFSDPQPYLIVPQCYSPLSSAPVQWSPTLPYGDPLPFSAFFRISSVIPNLTLWFPIAILRFPPYQFSDPQPYLMVSHCHSPLSSVSVQWSPTLPYGDPLLFSAFFRIFQWSPTLPYGSPLLFSAFFRISSMIPNLTLRWPIAILRFLPYQFSDPQPYLTLSVIPNFTLLFPNAILRFLPHQFSDPQPYLTVTHCHSPLSSVSVQWSPTLPYGFPLPFSAFLRISSVIPNLTLWFPIAILRFLPYQFSDPQPYLTVTHCHSLLSSVSVQWSPTLPYGFPLPFSAFFRISSVIPNLTLWFPIAILRCLPHQFSDPQPYLTVTHCHSPLSSVSVQWSPTLPYGSPLLFSAFFRTSSVIPNLTLRWPIAILRFLPYQFSDPQPYFMVPHCYSPLSFAPVLWSPTLPYGSPLLFSAFFRTRSVIHNLTLRWPIAILRFLPYQFNDPQPYLMVPHCSSPHSSAPVQWSPTLPYGSPLLFSAFFRTSSVIPNLTLWFPIAILSFLPHQFSDPQPYLMVPHCYSPLSSAPVQWSPTLPYCSPMLFSAFFRTSSVIPNLTLRWPIAILRFLPYQFSDPQPYLMVSYCHSPLSSVSVQWSPTLPYGFPLPFSAFFRISSVIPNLTLRWPIAILSFLPYQFSDPQPYLMVSHCHSPLSSVSVQWSPTLPYGSPLLFSAFFRTSSVIPNLTLRWPIAILRFLPYQFSDPQPYLKVPHCYSPLSSAPDQWSPTLPYGDPLPFSTSFRISSVIPNLTLWFPIAILRFHSHQFSDPQPYFMVPHCYSQLSSAPDQWSTTLPYGDPLPFSAFFRISSMIPNLTLWFPIALLRILPHQISDPQPYLMVPHCYSPLSSAPVQWSPTLPYGCPLLFSAFFRTSSVIPNLTLWFPIAILRFLPYQFNDPQP